MNKIIVNNDLINIFRNTFGIDFRMDNDYRNKKLLGNLICLSARDLLWLYFELEKKYDIIFGEEEIERGEFDTFNHIEKLILGHLKILK